MGLQHPLQISPVDSQKMWRDFRRFNKAAAVLAAGGGWLRISIYDPVSVAMTDTQRTQAAYCLGSLESKYPY